jgi:hypothetical protein
MKGLSRGFAGLVLALSFAVSAQQTQTAHPQQSRPRSFITGQGIPLQPSHHRLLNPRRSQNQFLSATTTTT